MSERIETKGMFRVLIVDDNRSLRKRIGEELLLALPDISVTEAADGLGCARALRDKPADLVIMDIRLKEENGLMLVPGILKVCPGANVIVHSMYDAREYREAASDLGASFFLSKKENSLQDMIAILKRLAG